MHRNGDSFSILSSLPLSVDLALEIRRRLFVWVSSFRYLCCRNDGVPVFPFARMPYWNDVVSSSFLNFCLSPFSYTRLKQRRFEFSNQNRPIYKKLRRILIQKIRRRKLFINYKYLLLYY